jgi:tetratricopeptide (TPR) repeat protein
MLKWLFSGIRSRYDPRHQEAEELEAKLHDAPRESRAKLLNRLGDAYLQLGETDAAVRYFGQGIDAYLETGHFDPAAALCRKLIGAAPSVVRAVRSPSSPSARASSTRPRRRSTTTSAPPSAPAPPATPSRGCT